jgi:hypothetical protein
MKLPWTVATSLARRVTVCGAGVVKPRRSEKETVYTPGGSLAQLTDQSSIGTPFTMTWEGTPGLVVTRSRPVVPGGPVIVNWFESAAVNAGLEVAWRVYVPAWLRVQPVKSATPLTTWCVRPPVQYSVPEPPCAERLTIVVWSDVTGPPPPSTATCIGPSDAPTTLPKGSTENARAVASGRRTSNGAVWPNSSTGAAQASITYPVPGRSMEQPANWASPSETA